VANLYPSIVGLGGRYTLHRPYIAGIACSWVSGSVGVLSGYTWQITGVYFGTTTYQQMTFKPSFFDWNSNKKTVDFILTDYFYVNVPGGPLATLPLHAQWVRRPATFGTYLSLDSLGFPDIFYLDLPPSPSGWWSG
jgi:hypothetical protein